MEGSSIKQDQKLQLMTTTPVQRLVCTMAVPTIISMMISSLYNMADTYFVGKLNTQSTAAVGIVFSVMAILQAFGFFFGQGSGNFISRKLGSRELEDANKMATLGFFLALLGGIVIMAAGILFLEPLALLLGSTPTILPYTKDYLRIILIGAPFMVAMLVLNNQLRFQGNAAYGMVGVVSGAVVNIGLDPLFIFVFDMGVAGAALATIISQFCSFVLLLVMNAKSGGVQIRLRYLKLERFFIKEIVRGGLPSLLRQGLASIAAIFLNKAAGVYGDVAIAAMSIVNRVIMFSGSILIGFGQGFQPVCGFNYGAKLYERVRKAYFFCIKIAVFFLSAAALLFMIFAPQIIRFFRAEDAEVIIIGARTLRFQSIALPLMGWIMISNMMLQSTGRVIRASIIAAARQGLFFLPLILILPGIFGLTGVQVTQAASDILTFFVSLPLAISVVKELKAEENQLCSKVTEM